ncbi:MAG: hypothetical protein NT140_04655 [Deltaproteobacteria bacterium]|nr:hypothetical protein [Deltaproteobacteria bacterium]
MGNIDFPKLSHDDAIKRTYALRPGCDEYCDGICDLERRKREREDEMLTMTETLVKETETLVKQTDKMLMIAKWSAALSIIAIAITLWQWWLRC